MHAGKTGKALARLDEALDEDVDNMRAYELAIPLWIDAGRIAEMRHRLERATARHPNFATGWYALAYAYRGTHRPDLAVLAYQVYITLRPGEAAPYFGLALAQKDAGEHAKAEAAFRYYLSREKDPARASFVDDAKSELAELLLERAVRAIVYPLAR